MLAAVAAIEESVKHLARKHERVRIFEVGRCFERLLAAGLGMAGLPDWVSGVAVVVCLVLGIYILFRNKRLLLFCKMVVKTLFSVVCPWYKTEPPRINEGIKFPYSISIAIGSFLALRFNFLECLFK